MKSFKATTESATIASTDSHSLVPEADAQYKRAVERSRSVYEQVKTGKATCHSRVSGCVGCCIVPLLNREGAIINHFVEHKNDKGEVFARTIGFNSASKDKKVASAAKALLHMKTKPELGGDASEEPVTDPLFVPLELTIDPDLAKMHMPDTIDTVPDDSSHLTSSLGSQIEQVQAQMRTSFSAPLVKRASRSIEQLVLLVVGLQYDTSLEAIVLRCVQFLSAITDGGIVLTLKDALMKYVSEAKVPDMLQGQTIKDVFEVEKSQITEPEMLSSESLKIWETLKQGVFTKHLSYILGTVFAFSACRIKNVKFSHPMYDKMMECAAAEEIDGMDLIDHAIKLYNWTSTVGMACLESRSLEPLTINTTTLAKCHERYYHWHKKFLDFKRSGKSTMEERQLMYVEVQTIMNKLAQFSKCQKEKFLTLNSSSLYKEVVALFHDVEDFVLKIDRVKVAEAYHVVGIPKTGKSTFCPKLAEQICLARGVEYREQDNAQVNLLSQYQDELNNATQVVTINECLPIKEHLAKSVETAYNTSLALVDPSPYHPNRSNLEDKAKITCQHIAVVSNGNTEEPFKHVAKDKGAWARRYKIIEMTVKDEFADEHGRIVSSKCDGSDDYHWFDIYEIVYGIDGKRTISYFEFDGDRTLQLNTSECLEFVRRKAIDHFKEQDLIMERAKKSSRKGCLTCKRLADYCKCPKADDFTTDGKSIHGQAVSVYTNLSASEKCEAGLKVGGKCQKCDFDVNDYCTRCGRDKPITETKPEMGIVQAGVQTAGSLVWSSMLPWINPFIKFQHLWSIDNNTMKVMHEEIVEELSYWPDWIGCTALSLVPDSWETNSDGSRSWYGRKKDMFLRALAAEKQIFLPLHYIFRRALFIGFLWFLFTFTICYAFEYMGLNPRSYEQVEMRERVYHEWDRLYFFPEYSPYVMARRDMYANMGIYTENYLDWKEYYVDIYWIQKILGWIYIPWYFKKIKWIPVIVQKQYQWWLMPTIVGVIFTLVLFFYMWFRRFIGFNKRYEELQKRCSADKELQRSLYDRAKRHTSEYNSLIPTAVGLVGAIVTGMVIWNSMRSTPESGGDLVRDQKTVTWNDWFSFNRIVAEPQESKNHSEGEAVKLLQNVMCTLSAKYNGEPRCVHGWFPEPGILMAPYHFFEKSPCTGELCEELDVNILMEGYKTTRRFYPKSLERISGKDMVLATVTKPPPFGKNYTYLLPKCTGSDHIAAKLHYQKVKVTKDSDGNETRSVTFHNEKLSCKYEDSVISGTYNCHRGLSYVSRVTRDGFCGSILFADRRNGAILGFHTAGLTHGLLTRKGFAQEITYDAYQETLARLKNHVEYITVPEMSCLCTTRLGHEIVPKEGPHPKTEMFKPGAMKEFNSIKVVGHTTELPKYRSRVRRSILSPGLEKHAKQRCRWKAPYMKEPWKHHNKSLKRIAEGAREVPPDSAEWALDDLWQQILPSLDKFIEEYPQFCRHLTLDEAINGVPGSLYMKKLRMDTAAGIPSGTKLDSGLFERLPDYEDGRPRYGLVPEAKKYYDDMVKCFDEGQSFGVYVRTCLKDEVVDEDSEKVRIFYILECIFAIICRQQYLSVCEFISRHPLTTECMVGVNCAGPEWEQIMKHLKELATDGMLTDWDYSGYDIRRSADVTIISMKFKKRITERMRYERIYLRRQDGIIMELRRPLVNWNGTIVFLYIWCSGNTITVYGNSIENALHMRISFHWNGIRVLGEVEFYKLGPFKNNERIITYGDDGASGSRPELREICGFKAKKRYFDYINMGITNARKTDDDDDVIDSSLVDFLKRKSVYHEKLGTNVGALQQDSIWKMGHMSHGKGEDEDLAIAASHSMLYEAFLHGEEFYEHVRTALRATFSELPQKIWSEALDVTYHERAENWLQKYT